LGISLCIAFASKDADQHPDDDTATPGAPKTSSFDEDDSIVYENGEPFNRVQQINHHHDHPPIEHIPVPNAGSRNTNVSSSSCSDELSTYLEENGTLQTLDKMKHNVKEAIQKKVYPYIKFAPDIMFHYRNPYNPNINQNESDQNGCICAKILKEITGKDWHDADLRNTWNTIQAPSKKHLATYRGTKVQAMRAEFISKYLLL
jgi:hypothetical protein